MKRFLSLVLALVLVFALVGCGGGGKDIDMTAGEVLDKVLEGVEDLPMVQTQTLAADTFEFFAFAPWVEGYDAVVSEAMINAVAHSVVVIRTADSAAAAELAKTVEANANPNKWICVSAEKTIVRQHGSYVLLVMSYDATAQAIAGNFDSLFA